MAQPEHKATCRHGIVYVRDAGVHPTKDRWYWTSDFGRSGRGFFPSAETALNAASLSLKIKLYFDKPYDVYWPTES